MSSIKVPHVKTKSQQSLFQSILRYAKSTGFKLSSGTAREKIGYIADFFEVNFEELTDPSKIEEQYNGPTYVLFGVRHVVSPPTIHPWMVVVDDTGIINDELLKSQSKILNLLENNGITPHAWGVDSGHEEWGNVGPFKRVTDMNGEELISFLSGEDSDLVIYYI